MTLYFTNRSIWFNGLCSFELYFDSQLSTKDRLLKPTTYNSVARSAFSQYTLCTTTIIPQET
jgi:hypothetical protein